MRIIITFTALPKGIYGITLQSKSCPDQFLVLCDNTGHIQRRRHSFGHELAHIFCGHFDTEDVLKISGEGADTKIYEHGTLLRKDDTTGKLDRNTSSEREANAQAWHYYRRFRDQFLKAERTGKATITI